MKSTLSADAAAFVPASIQQQHQKPQDSTRHDGSRRRRRKRNTERQKCSAGPGAAASAAAAHHRGSTTRESPAAAAGQQESGNSSRSVVKSQQKKQSSRNRRDGERKNPHHAKKQDAKNLNNQQQRRRRHRRGKEKSTIYEPEYGTRDGSGSRRSTTRDDQNSIISEMDLFPALPITNAADMAVVVEGASKSTITDNGTPAASSSVWSRSAGGTSISAVWEPSPRPEAVTEPDEVSDEVEQGLTRLIPLTSGRDKDKRKTNPNAVTTESTLKIQDSIEPPVEESKDEEIINGLDDKHQETAEGSQLPTRKALDITRLRDKWWLLLEEHNRKRQEECRQKAEELQLERNESSSSTGNSADDDDSIEDSCNEFSDSYKILDLSKSKGSQVRADPGPQRVNYDEKIQSTAPTGDEGYYGQVAWPLHEAIRRNDADALERLLARFPTDNAGSNDNGHLQGPAMSPMQLAVSLGMPHLVRILCSALSGHSTSKSKELASDPLVAGRYSQPPLLIAAERGFDECIQILTSTFGTNALLTSCDPQGNMALHCCCRGAGECDDGGELQVAAAGISTFHLILEMAASSCSGSASSVQFRLLTCRNEQKQTPVHVACQYGRADLIDAILNHKTLSNVSMLSKLFAMQDIERQTPLLSAVASGSTDIVMSLLMWRGNNHALNLTPSNSTHAQKKKNSGKAYSEERPAPCPLAWAVRARDVDMVLLLLEFNPRVPTTPCTSESGFDLEGALLETLCASVVGQSGCAVDHSDVESARAEIVRALVAAGANPCAVPDETRATKTNKLKECAVVRAAKNHDAECLAELLDSYHRYLNRVHQERRRDPVLQKQPESFFAIMESKEKAELKSAKQEALLFALFQTWQSVSSQKDHLITLDSSCSLVLFRRGAKLDEESLARLQASLVEGRIVQNVPESTPELRTTFPVSYSTTCRQPLSQPESELDTSGDFLNKTSRLLLSLPWFGAPSSISVKCSMLNVAPEDLQDPVKPDAMLISSDKSEYLVHNFVLARSDKLNAAVRFASMSRKGVEDDSEAVTEVTVDLPDRLLRPILEHLYHGSIVSGLSKDPECCCQDLLELLLVGEEYLCRSLIQECEMRLLASDSDFDRCFCSHSEQRTRYSAPKELRDNNGILYSECQYTVQGPPRLISHDVALDVLAVAQQVQSCTFVDYALHIKRPIPESKSKSGGDLLRFPLEALREATLCVILREFDLITKGPAFASILDDLARAQGEVDEGRGIETLLQSILDDFRCLGRKEPLGRGEILYPAQDHRLQPSDC